MTLLNKVVWVLAMLMVIANVIINYFFLTSSSIVWLSILDGAVQVAMLLGIACVLALIVSAVPFRGLEYGLKFNSVLPFMVALTAAVLNMLFLSVANF